jgi:phosphatidylglycerol:prolipoprotein diacylglycerol transferase
VLRELFRIPGLDLPVYGYGLMLVLGVWCAIELARRLAIRFGMNGDDFATLGLLALFSGVVGARLSHILENLDVYTDADRSVLENLKAAVNLSNGGLTFYGGFLFATAVLIGYGKWKKIPIRRGMDVVAPCLMVGLMFGRVGCLLNGCCWGGVCDPDRVPWALTFPYDSPPHEHHVETGQIKVGFGEDQLPPTLVERVPLVDGSSIQRLVPARTVAADPSLAALAKQQRSLPVHPTQIYSVLNAALILAATLLLLMMRPVPLRVFGLMLAMYGPGRFTLELLRVNVEVGAGMTFSMWISIGIAVAGVALLLLTGPIDRFIRSRERPKPA